MRKSLVNFNTSVSTNFTTSNELHKSMMVSNYSSSSGHRRRKSAAGANLMNALAENKVSDFIS